MTDEEWRQRIETRVGDLEVTLAADRASIRTIIQTLSWVCGILVGAATIYVMIVY